jgi:SAM-dependent methyltransferase
MKISNPISKFHVKVPRSYKVLEVGGGHDPNPRSNVIVDKFIDTNYHRSGNIKVLMNQEFVQAEGESLPFGDKEFDYVICNHVLEHVEDPIKFLKEQSRVAKRGYLEVPSLIGEYLAPKKSHRWLILEIDEKIVAVEKSKVDFQVSHDFGELFLHFFPSKSIGFKIIERTYGNLMTIRHEWEDEVECIVNPDNEYYLKYFREPWDIKTCQELFPNRSYKAEFWASVKALFYISRSLFNSKILKNKW